jgi:hypothetical protein
MSDFLSASTIPFPNPNPVCQKAAKSLKIGKKIFLRFLSLIKVAAAGLPFWNTWQQGVEWTSLRLDSYKSDCSGRLKES